MKHPALKCVLHPFDSELSLPYDMSKEHGEGLYRAILDVLLHHYLEYEKHDLFRQGFKTGEHISFHKPYMSRTALWVESGAARFATTWQFDWAVNTLVFDAVAGVVDQPTNSSPVPTDFRDADIGDLYLKTPLLCTVYTHAVVVRCLSRQHGEK